MKMRSTIWAVALIVAMAGTASAAALSPVPAAAQLKLAEGPTDVKAGDMTLRIVKAHVGSPDASAFDTFTVYVLPRKAGDPWLQATVPGQKGLGYNLRSYETADANIQSIAFYQQGGHLYAVQAARASGGADTNMAKARVDIKVFKFNQDWDVPKFDNEGAMSTKGNYHDAADALPGEFFVH
jgi:opacity protein-like surface antigen